jgi:hypothetical protein
MTNQPPTDLGDQLTDCAYCIDGLRPFTVDPYMGPIYQGCTDCGCFCTGCEGRSVFPAAPGHQRAFIAALNEKGWAPVFCSACTGVTHLIQIPTMPEDQTP